jgi:omega-6 fatty acid desaturase (delta-12 desaturase)
MTDAGISTTDARDTGSGPGSAFWRETLAPYARPHLGRSALDIVTSVVPYLLLTVAAYLLLDVSYLLVLALMVPTAGFLVRTYILFHDCAHGSFLPWRRANSWLGSICALLVFTPFRRWQYQHAVHHATSGDLERRGVGDLPTLTVAEYEARSWRGRLGYRLFRNPLVMFGIGPVWAMIFAPRWISPSERPHIRLSVIRTNLALAALIGLLCWLVGWREYLLVQMPPALLAGSIGVWLFYVQHQFEDAYWENSDGWRL